MSKATWHAFETGCTLGEIGSERGKIIRDEEHAHGARITLERNTSIAPFTITCGVYGWMVHTRYFETDVEAVAEYDKMKASLSEIVERFSDPNCDDRGSTEKAIQGFVEMFP